MSDGDPLHALRVLVLVFVGVAVLLFAYTIWQSYEGRVDLRRSQVAGCKRALKDRRANAMGWRTAEAARRASGTPSDLQAAARYDLIAGGLEARAAIHCDTAFPSPTLLP